MASETPAPTIRVLPAHHLFRQSHRHARLAQSRAAKIEAQHRQAKSIQRLHGMENDFVVQGPAVARVRVADQGSVARLRRACIE